MPPRKSKPSLPTPLSSHSHAGMRANIPTEELRNFIAKDDPQITPIFADQK